MLFRPMADKGLVYDWMACWLYMGMRGRVRGGYLGQELLAKLQQAASNAIVNTPELVGVSNAHIE
jgi:hypothetical protein